MLPVRRVMYRWKPVLAVVAHAIELRPWLNIWKRWITSMRIAVLIPLATTLLYTDLLARIFLPLCILIFIISDITLLI